MCDHEALVPCRARPQLWHSCNSGLTSSQEQSLELRCWTSVCPQQGEKSADLPGRVWSRRKGCHAPAGPSPSGSAERQSRAGCLRHLGTRSSAFSVLFPWERQGLGRICGAQRCGQPGRASAALGNTSASVEACAGCIARGTETKLLLSEALGSAVLKPRTEPRSEQGGRETKSNFQSGSTESWHIFSFSSAQTF